jgi:FkbH-like protein
MVARNCLGRCASTIRRIRLWRQVGTRATQSFERGITVLSSPLKLLSDSAVKLVEALEALKRNPAPESPALEVQLACGFTPLHFLTFLGAHLCTAFPTHRVAISTGTFGDLPGNLERLARLQNSTVVVVVEWQDLDPRLGIRLLGGWNPAQLGDFVQSVRDQAARIIASSQAVAQKNTVVVALPTLPIPPVAFTPGWMSSRLEIDLQDIRATLSTELAELSKVRVVSSQRLDHLSPFNERFDAKSELNTGFPYTLSHADKLAGLIATLVKAPPAKKGLITDLDNTLWMGILGEVNPEGISWDLDHHAQKHGLYQQLLLSLAESGTLIGVATKNDPALVEEAFRSRKPLLTQERIFPLEAGWGPKSESVRKIIEAWNIGPDSVVFIDDSALEIAEVQSAHPDVECVLFPKNDDKAAYDLLNLLRDKFGKTSVSAEDTIRLESIRASNAIREATRVEGYTPERFLQEAEGKLSLSFVKDPPDPRALELVNKTNQFNLNGRRHTEASWREYLTDPNVFLMLVSYEDKYGPLGKIAVLTGRVDASNLVIDHWVMSCRAFSRRIEHGCLLHVFHKLAAERATFDYSKTERNQPVLDFLCKLTCGADPEAYSISRKQFFDNCPAVYLQIEERKGG